MPVASVERVAAAATLAVDAQLSRRAKVRELRESAPDLANWMPKVSRHYERPDHLAPLIALLERAEREPVRAVVSAPPRHGKTSLVQHAIARRLQRRPGDVIGYASYSAPLARSKSRDARDLAGVAGVTLRDDATSASQWRTPEGGGLFAAGVGGSWTGFGFNLFLIDDPLKNRADAESHLVRESLWAWFQSSAYTRLEPGGSAIVVSTRWHDDDLSGRLIRDGWESVNLPALSDDGAALWPGRWPAAELLKIKATVGEYEWAALYRGEPRPKGGAVFRDAYFYDELPATGYRSAIGADFAYTARTHADYSVAILGRLAGGTVYIEAVERHQVEVPRFGSTLAEMARRSGAGVAAFISGTERGTLDFLARDHDLRIRGEAATLDKYQRAQPVAAAWNRGEVLVPRRASWLDAFVSEVCGFTGVGDAHDDQVDALAALHHALLGARPVRHVAAY